MVKSVILSGIKIERCADIRWTGGGVLDDDVAIETSDCNGRHIGSAGTGGYEKGSESD